MLAFRISVAIVVWYLYAVWSTTRVVLQTAYGYHTTIATLIRNANTHRTRYNPWSNYELVASSWRWTYWRPKHVEHWINNNKTSGIKLVSLYSTIKMLHGPINIRFTFSLLLYACHWSGHFSWSFQIFCAHLPSRVIRATFLATQSPIFKRIINWGTQSTPPITVRTNFVPDTRQRLGLHGHLIVLWRILEGRT